MASPRADSWLRSSSHAHARDIFPTTRVGVHHDIYVWWTGLEDARFQGKSEEQTRSTPPSLTGRFSATVWNIHDAYTHPCAARVPSAVSNLILSRPAAAQQRPSSRQAVCGACNGAKNGVSRYMMHHYRMPTCIPARRVLYYVAFR